MNNVISASINPETFRNYLNIDEAINVELIQYGKAPINNSRATFVRK
jgi:hypothetical protein